ncbi:hypothetical protein [Luteibacter aegosomatissinici]|uniref:hypothetical protein n=1 Tax=Luteibacter aegosomatissinici TaxID=2911539 RepID=UPI001FF9AB2D|nr:hypothetical protein [Luteibacter aegosomatissinici]UPG96189.1 hypothetical protein L2Y97_08795 [Luteibacter aegosomatissinici]
MIMRFCRIFCLGTLAIASLSRPVHAGDLPGADEYLRLADVVIAAQKEAGAALPESDARVQALVAAASDRKVFGRSSIAESRSMSGEDVIRVSDIMIRTGEVLHAYLKTDTATSPPKDLLAGAVVNARKYEGVVGPLFAFSLSTTGRAIAGFTTLLGKVPADQRAAKMPAVREIRRGSVILLSDVFGMTWPVEGAEADAREDILHAAADVAPVVAGALTLAERKDIWRRAFRAHVLAAPGDQATFQKIERAFMSADCVDLCAFGE